jgi:VIT1/CCC1 family predicted Fe2+/Mn2+ transporter
MAAASRRSTHRNERHTAGSVSDRLNWLRAGVLGANDGIISTAGLVIGVAAATADRDTIATAGIAGLVAGAVSMALGEYVSVSTQRDTEKALVDQERRELREMPQAELNELIGMLKQRGLSDQTATTAAEELHAADPLEAHVTLELGLTPNQTTNPWVAAFSSLISFTLGSLLPLIAILLPPESVRIPVAFIGVLVGLTITGALSAELGGSPKSRAVVRLVGGGAMAMAVTFAIGELLDTTVA